MAKENKLPTKRVLAAIAGAAAILIGGSALASTPARDATGGGCDSAYYQVDACISEASNGQIWADAYVNSGYSGCWIDIKIYETDTSPWYILNEQGYPCDYGGHVGPIGVNINVNPASQYGDFVAYATLNNGAYSYSPGLCVYC